MTALKDQPWPRDEQEELGQCALCASPDRTLLHAKLWDNVFNAAPGRWQMWRCESCRSGYLDPRPNEATIGRAYGVYYTHENEPEPLARTWRGRFLNGLGNGYRNHRFGTQLSPAYPAGRFIARCFPPLIFQIAISYRFLPKRDARIERVSVLDIGCGNGTFLDLARDAGWQAFGTDPDPLARRMAAEKGLTVLERIEDWFKRDERFDFVTLNHVIEHVHDPATVLRQAASLLRPGGEIYIQTPNIDAQGHRLYGTDWRGLEPPRHLVLFNHKSLTDALDQAGFVSIRDVRINAPFELLRNFGRADIGFGAAPNRDDGSPLPRPTVADRFKSAFSHERSEALTLMAATPA